MHASPDNAARPSPAHPAAIHGYSGVWAITLWTAGRVPLLVALGRDGVGLSRLGWIVQQQWEDIERRFFGVTRDEFVILPDRLRALVHVPTDRRAGSVGRMVGWLKARVGRIARREGLALGIEIWEAGFEGQLLMGPEELALWRRRIRTGLTGVFGSLDRAG